MDYSKALEHFKNTGRLPEEIKELIMNWLTIFSMRLVNMSVITV